MDFYKIISKEDKINLLKLTSKSEKLKKDYIDLAKEIKVYFEVSNEADERIDELERTGGK